MGGPAWASALSLTTTVLSVVMYFVRDNRDDLSADEESVPYLNLNCGETNTCECSIAVTAAGSYAGIFKSLMVRAYAGVLTKQSGLRYVSICEYLVSS